MAARQAMRNSEPYAGPVRLILDNGVSIPSSWSQRCQREAAAGVIGATKKPDADNVVKALKDGMNGVVYGDDGQVVDLWVPKHYAITPGVRSKQSN
ncbi:RusA family crossover junction endodeoxyribonuclease [Burkholderia multivorans]|nr:RusA family crossover junction endodeoxyribonuclease [Burkholderia multivorans]MDN7477757.1 RusA family crossover junction endodeoxyribonuclease [Burkholderia multivorans]